MRLERSALDLKLKLLANFIGELGSHFATLAADLNQAGFGPQSVGQARQFWEIFLETTALTTSEEPWMLSGDFALDFAAHTEYRAAALTLLEGLIRHGERSSIAAAILDVLRGDFQRLTSGEKNSGDKAAPERDALHPGKRKSGLPAILVVVACLLAVVTAAYFNFDKLRRLEPSARSAAAESAAKEAEETIPPVGTGQHLELSAVRYCHYQEERLKLMQPDVRGPEAVRAFNLLAVDYNSRCSDFFYKDSDLATVKAEIATNRQTLAAEAKRTVATWADHADLPLLPSGRQDKAGN
jgi:hypothetical protein